MGISPRGGEFTPAAWNNPIRSAVGGYSSVSTTTDLAGNVTVRPSAVSEAPVNGWG